MTKLNMSLFQKRRDELMQLMEDGIAIFPTAPEIIRNGDVHFIFRPDSDFYYLTHFPEPQAVAVLVPGQPNGKFILFCRQRDYEKETWHGVRSGLEGAVKTYGADDAFPIEDISDILPGMLENKKRIYCNMGRYPDFDNQLIGWLKASENISQSSSETFGKLVDIGHILHEMRLIKTKDEIKLMSRAAEISASAHRRAMQTCQPNMYEYEIESELEYVFRKEGARSTAYPSIIAGGANACVLHYTDNNTRLNDGELLLIDAGAEIDCYASDITRTFPINGRFTNDQLQLYDIVLSAQEAAIAQVHPGNTWNQPHEAAINVISQGLIDLGLLIGPLDQVIEEQQYRKFYMHKTGHWLGMDVHDVGDYQIGGKWRLLEPGMALTIEPGIYIPPDHTTESHWHNIGIRIEDDILVTHNGHQILTNGVPKMPKDIEALMNN
ncbi:MAG: Xaa-Pro aminopeptidase [Acidiferrobacteraceae bacterium]|nr:Xaa-Pro aminopeptidase [Acidiferrobacteraceae bacterium]|tara:strand:+ start:1829 stop:3139 length:1311 start_codon:yes stop_codon:yes gene_type:complete